MTTDGAIQLVLDHLNVTNQIQERLNAKRRQLRINTTQMVVLAMLTPGRAATAPEQASAAELAARLLEHRETISIQLKGLAENGLVEVVEPAQGEDRRWRRFRVTKAGAAKGWEARKLLVQLEIVLRTVLGHEMAQIHARAVQRLATDLPEAPPLSHDCAAAQFRDETIRSRRRNTLERTKRSMA